MAKNWNVTGLYESARGKSERGSRSLRRGRGPKGVRPTGILLPVSSPESDNAPDVADQLDAQGVHLEEKP